MSSLAGYLNSQIYYPQANRFGSFITWDKTSLVRFNTYEIMRRAEEIKNITGNPVLVVLNYMPKEKDFIFNSGLSFTFLGCEPTAIVANEIYSIWIIQ